MPENYTQLVAALKSLTKAEDPAATDSPTVTLPMAEDEWNTRPDADSYGLVSLDFEAGQLNGDNAKLDRSHGGSADLFSRHRDGDGWPGLITGTLQSYCGPAWSLNSHTYERETRLFHWEWAFEIEG